MQLTHPRRVVSGGVVSGSGKGGGADAEAPGLLLLPEAIALPPDVERVAMVEQTIEDGAVDAIPIAPSERYDAVLTWSSAGRG